MSRGAIALAFVAAFAAAPAEARMSQLLLFGEDLLGGFSVQQASDPAGTLFQQMFRDFANTPERLPKGTPRNDMDATLDAMERAKVGFGQSRPEGNGRRPHKARPKS